MSDFPSDANPDADADHPLVVRVVELEMRLSFQDQYVAELNEALVDHADRIALLERQLSRALMDLEKVRGALMADPADEAPPPHY